ncbi:hypothetical protein DIZ27_20585 [Streptomyces sp. NWU339]|uniref:DDE-type integrase/transposase/recombinase n=1 Tax=Streptomyces sp. NWU339 TaxID=2185284 RepID=UPI000D677586|nr:DDE-type integrase/transposase/recombinase [Streptomyces sp. NWU339]PWI08844.1 hypothetical protein DIZ27_20585 [Streptomyces sp. NWU339]
MHRRFEAVAPNVLRVGDMTEIETGEGKRYLATVLDLFSRRLLGCAMGAHHDAGLVGASLQMAAATRGARSTARSFTATGEDAPGCRRCGCP